MKYIIEMSAKFKKDHKPAKKCGYDTNLLNEVIDILAEGETLPEKYYDHPLSGNYYVFRECYILPD